LYLASQDLQRAREALSENIQLLAKEGANDQLVDTYRLLGEIALAMGDMELAKACAERIQSLTVSLSENTRDLSTIQRGEFWRFRGMLATALGEWEAAARFLKTGEKIFQSLGSRFHQGRAAFQLGVLAEAQGDQRTAQLRFREAVLLFRSVGARLEQQRAEEAFQRQFN
jgi:tetratricopeptide (TPR) repeat protein